MKSVAVLLLFGVAAFAQNSRALEGSVVNSVTGAGIEGARVVLMGRGMKDATTDATGTFRIAGIAPGDYAAMAQKNGFFTPQSAFPRLGTSVHVGTTGDLPRLRLELLPPAILRGHVFDTDAKPAANVQVALGPEYEKKATTDEEGAFVFENVQPGEHSLAASGEHARTYFPATTDPESAESITVLPGANQGGYEIRLQTARVYRVRGIVLDAAGEPSANTIVHLLPDLPGMRESQFTIALTGSPTMFSLSSRRAGAQPARESDVVSGKNGAFEFPEVREGDWILRAESEEINRGAAVISVRKDIDDVQIRLEAPLEILGSVVLSDGSPAPAKNLMVMLNPLDGTRNTARRIDKGGDLRIEDVGPGRYRITAIALSGSYYAASVMVGEVDAMRQPALLNDSSPPLRIILKPGGTLSGHVDKGEGAKLLLVPQTLVPGDIAKAFPCGAGGNFELAGIVPGDYYAIAVTQLDLFRTRMEDVRAIMRDATPVRVEEGALTSVQLKQPVAPQ